MWTVYRSALSLLVILHVFQVHSQTEEPCVTPLEPSCDACVDPDLDLSTGCTTCMESGPIECTPGDQDCGVGDFTFSALFHSYANPTAMCGECGPDGETITCETANGGGPMTRTNCILRFIYCLQPYGSPANDVPFDIQQAAIELDEDSDSRHTFEEGFIIQQSDRNRNLWNRSNPFTRELQTWPGRVQFYIVTSHSRGSNFSIVDRVQIDLELNLSTTFTERATYSGIHGISEFDMSFRLSGQCAENYYGPRCNIFCSEVEGQSTCDSEGNIVCVNPDGDPQNNCQPDTTVAESTTTAIPSVSSSSALVGGVVGGVLGAGLLIVLLLIILLQCIHIQKAKRESGVTLPAQRDTVTTSEEKIEMTQNQLYGVRSTGDNITMEANVVYGVTGDGPVEGPYDYVQT